MASRSKCKYHAGRCDRCAQRSTGPSRAGTVADGYSAISVESHSSPRRLLEEIAMRNLPSALAGSCIVLAASLGLAAERRIEGVVRSVEPQKWSITVTTKTAGKEQDEILDVLKKAKVTVDGQSAELKDVRKGQRASIVFNSELEVATKIDATGEGVT